MRKDPSSQLDVALIMMGIVMTIDMKNTTTCEEEEAAREREARVSRHVSVVEGTRGERRGVLCS